MRLVLAALLAASLLAGCSSPQASAPEPPPTGENNATQTTAPSTSMASVGKWQGEAGDRRLTLDLKAGSEVEWTEETAESKKSWTGKWRDEGGELYLLLNKPTSRNALFEKKGDTWVEVSIDGQPAMKDAELVLKKI